MKYGYFSAFFFSLSVLRKLKEMISVQLFSMLKAISSSWARQAFCASRSSFCVWILMLWSSYRARNPTGTKTPVHNPESPPTTQQCRVTKHITNSLVLECLHMQNLSPNPGRTSRKSTEPASLLRAWLKVDHTFLGHIQPLFRGDETQGRLGTLIQIEQQLWFTLAVI